MENVFWQKQAIDKSLRQRLNGHKSLVIWFTGLSGSGKSTIANALELELHNRGLRTFLLDGDHIRHGLNSDLGFSETDRIENIRRIGEVAKLFVGAGCIVLAAFISPYLRDRERVRFLFAANEFVEVYVKCPLAVCEQRDPKQLYKKALNGEISNFTGISAPYEEPEKPEMVIESDRETVEDAIRKIIRYLEERNCFTI
ncbi:adenylyl-sulfate kinase [Neobacillus sp. SM06]|uniref:adenylyl-sulfate kinase n=1 Tax=Neobacillus sp. SM06 TaxID=3422492 RepID=UPI003D2BD8C4